MTFVRNMAKQTNMNNEETLEKIFIVAGVKFPVLGRSSRHHMKKALSFKPHPRDVIICSYPKCDSKTIEMIVWKLLYPTTSLPTRNYFLNRYLDPIDILGIPDELAQKKAPRLLKSYLPCKLLPFYKRAKYIYVVRTPWNACTSYYKFLYNSKQFNESFDKFFELFLKGDIAYGCYFQHVLSWTNKSEDSNVLILCHEHVKHNPRSAISTIAAFLGDCYLKKLLQSDELQNDILNMLKWENFKPAKKCCKKSSDLDEIDFQEIICSEKQLEQLVTKMDKETKGTCIEHLWLNLLKK